MKWRIVKIIVNEKLRRFGSRLDTEKESQGGVEGDLEK